MNPFALTPFAVSFSLPELSYFLRTELFLLQYMRRLLFGVGF